MNLDFLRRDIEYRMKQIGRQKRDIAKLKKLGIDTVSAEALLERMCAKVEELRAQRDTATAKDLSRWHESHSRRSAKRPVSVPAILKVPPRRLDHPLTRVASDELTVLPPLMPRSFPCRHVVSRAL